MEKKDKKRRGPSKLPDLNKEIVQYATRLTTTEISALNVKAQDLIMFLLAEWRRSKKETLVFSGGQIRDLLGLSEQSNAYLDRMSKKVLSRVVQRSVVAGQSGSMVAALALIPKITFDLKTETLTAVCLPELLSVLGEYDTYTRFSLKVFMSVKKKYAKNLFRLFCRYYKGSFLMDIDDFRKEFGATERMSNAHLVTNIKSAVEELKSLGIFSDIKYNFEYGLTRGQPLEGVSFKFEVNQEKVREILGQEQLPGLVDDGAALSPKQAAPGGAAAPAPVPPAAAEKPLLTGEDLIKPSAKQILQAIAADGKPSGNAGGGKRAAPEPPKCPLCHAPLKKLRNSLTGEFFWGCSNFPKCSFSKDYRED